MFLEIRKNKIALKMVTFGLFLLILHRLNLGIVVIILLSISNGIFSSHFSHTVLYLTFYYFRNPFPPGEKVVLRGKNFICQRCSAMDQEDHSRGQRLESMFTCEPCSFR